MLTQHAHYLGKEMELTATLPDGETIDLLRINDFDFNWQEQYQYAEFVRLPKGTRLDARAADNSTDNPRNPSTPPVRVKWGRESTDEMGSVSLRMMPVDEADLVTLQEAYREHVREAASECRSVRTGASVSNAGPPHRLRATNKPTSGARTSPTKLGAPRDRSHGALAKCLPQ